MESSPLHQTPDDASSALAAANRARDRLAAGIRLPSGLFPALALAIAVQVGAGAYGIAAQTTTGLAVALGGAAIFLAVAALLLTQFRRINGVAVDGLASTIVLGTGTGTVSTLVYLATIAAATWAAFESHWWLVVAAAGTGGAAYSFSALLWWRAYRTDPVARAGGVSPRMLGVLALVAVAGFVVLMVGS